MSEFLKLDEERINTARGIESAEDDVDICLLISRVIGARLTPGGTTVDRVCHWLEGESVTETKKLPPWRFNGPEGSIVLHPEALIVSIEACDMYAESDSSLPAKRLGQGSHIMFVIPPSAARPEGQGIVTDVTVLEPPEQVEDQIRERGGWKEIP